MKIPELKLPKNKKWAQPDPKNVVIKDGCAFMTQTTADQLKKLKKEPKFVAVGQMWKTQIKGAYLHFKIYLADPQNDKKHVLHSFVLVIASHLVGMK